MKKLLAVSLSTMMVLSMSACGGSDSSADTTAAQETEAEVTVETEAETEAETEELPGSGRRRGRYHLGYSACRDSGSDQHKLGSFRWLH